MGVGGVGDWCLDVPGQKILHRIEFLSYQGEFVLDAPLFHHEDGLLLWTWFIL